MQRQAALHSNAGNKPPWPPPIAESEQEAYFRRHGSCQRQSVACAGFTTAADGVSLVGRAHGPAAGQCHRGRERAGHCRGCADRPRLRVQDREVRLATLCQRQAAMLRRTPVQSSTISHGWRPVVCDRLSRAGRSRGSLIDWRSGGAALAQHPVVRSALPAPAARRVSCGPTSGKRTWPSRRTLGTAHAAPIRAAFAPPKVHQ